MRPSTRGYVKDASLAGNVNGCFWFWVGCFSCCPQNHSVRRYGVPEPECCADGEMQGSAFGCSCPFVLHNNTLHASCPGRARNPASIAANRAVISLQALASALKSCQMHYLDVERKQIRFISHCDYSRGSFLLPGVHQTRILK